MKTIHDYIKIVDEIQEGAIGTAVGAGLGALAGSALGPVGTLGGAAIGSKLGDMAGEAIGHIFDSSSKGHSSTDVQKDPESGNYFAAGPDGHTMMAVTPPPGGFGQNTIRKNAAGDEIDPFGNTYKDYVAQEGLHSVTANMSLKAGGKYADEIQSLEDARGTREKVIESWDFKGATLALLCGDRTRGKEGSTGVWGDIAHMASMGGDLFSDFYKSRGYEMVSNKFFTASNKLGDLSGEVQELKKGLLGDIVHAGAAQEIAFESPKGKGLHIIEAQFIGPASAWKDGGQEQFKKLCDSMEPAANIKLLKGTGS